MNINHSIDKKSYTTLQANMLHFDILERAWNKLLSLKLNNLETCGLKTSICHENYLLATQIPQDQLDTGDVIRKITVELH